MPKTDFVHIKIGDREIDLYGSDIDLSINYQLEDRDNFQVKTSAEARDVSVPATLSNDKAFNTFHNPGIEDFTKDADFTTFKNATIEVAGVEILKGKALLTKATHKDVPISYNFNFYGDNADWIIDLSNSTLYDFVKTISLNYTKSVIEQSWSFDGRDLSKPYVFAPVRYMLPFDNIAFDPTDTVAKKLAHYITNPTYLCPSLSIYYILFQAFKSIGYTIKSTFLNTDYFRRLVMPWTFGPFPYSNGTKQDIHKFVAASKYPNSGNNNNITTINYFDFSNQKNNNGHRYIDYVDLKVTADGSVTGTYDNNFTANGVKDFTYNTVGKNEMMFTYNAPDFGIQTVNLSVELYYELGTRDNSEAILEVVWYIKRQNQSWDFNNELKRERVDRSQAPYLSTFSGWTNAIGTKEMFLEADINKGDSICCRVWLNYYNGKGDNVKVKLGVNAFRFNFFKTPLTTGTVNFDDYTFFKQYKFTDFLKGIIDCFNLSIKPDTASKVLIIEPTHDYKLSSGNYPGYFNNDFIDWNNKQDLSKTSELSLFNGTNREYVFKMKEDSGDGCYKVVSDRIQSAYQYKQDLISTSQNTWAITKSLLGAGKYVFPDRFPKGITEMENSFFSACMHYLEINWQDITGVAPQLICIIPENISNTSASQASNTFTPKIAYYKGDVSGVGGWNWDNQNRTTLPFLFGVNYNQGGELDPILSYCNEKIGNTVGIGLMQRFYLQRLATMRVGKYYETYLHLNNYDVSNVAHREHIGISGQRWELTAIEGYKPTADESTKCSLRKWTPIMQVDKDSIYPTDQSINGVPQINNIFETKYQQLMCLAGDIPQNS